MRIILIKVIVLLHWKQILNNQPRPPQSVNLQSLAPGAGLFVSSAREWARAARRRQCVMRPLVGRYQQMGCLDALALLDECMSLLAAAAFRPVCIHCPQAAQLSADEYRLALLLQALQREDSGSARSALAPIVAGRLNFSVRRAAADYVKVVVAARLSCIGVRHLRLVASR